MLCLSFMSLLPFVLVGVLNGLVVGCAAGLVARAIADSEASMRFRDTSALGMIGAILGCVVATATDSESGYIGGPSSLLFSVGGALALLVLANVLRRRSIGQLTRSG